MIPQRFFRNLLNLALASLCLLPFAHGNDAKQFSDYYELEPFQIVGEEIPITVFARTSGDRRYATRFTHNVVEVVYETIERSPGSGLVIIGRSGEPHPLTIIESFLNSAESPSASPELKRIAAELNVELQKWRAKINFEDGSGNEDFDFDVNKLINAVPIPLLGVAADLYLLAWKVEFDPERVEQTFSNLSLEDLRRSEFQEFQWIFYLPPRNALNQVIKEVLPAIMEAENFGFMKRMLLRGAIATFKPVLKDAMEGLRKGVLYWSVLQASQAFSEEEINQLAEAYLKSQMPRGRIIPGDKKDRALEAVREQKAENVAYAKDPFVIPETLESFDSANYSRFVGEYGASGHRTKRFIVQSEKLYWKEGEDEPIEYFPASETFLVSKNQDITIEFLKDELGQFSEVELRKGRDRWTFDRIPDIALDTAIQ